MNHEFINFHLLRNIILQNTVYQIYYVCSSDFYCNQIPHFRNQGYLFDKYSRIVANRFLSLFINPQLFLRSRAEVMKLFHWLLLRGLVKRVSQNIAERDREYVRTVS